VTQKQKFALHLHRTGDIFKESILVLSQWNKTGSWLALKELILNDGLLQKGTRNTEIAILREIKRRYISAPDWLPDAACLGQFLSKEISNIVKNQVLFVYAYHADHLIKLVFDKIIDEIHEGFLVRNATIVNYLTFIASQNKVSWSQNTLKKWAVKFKTMLRNIGYLNGNYFTKPYIREEAFAFFLLWLFFKTRSIKKSLSHKAFRPLCLTNEDKQYLLKKGIQKNWWYYTEGGGLVEFIPNFKKIANWIDALGQKEL